MRISGCAACFAVLLACSPTRVAPPAIKDEARYVGAYVTVDGKDTVSRELVAWCGNRIVGELATTAPVARAQYDVALGADGIPRELIIGVWRGRVPAPKPDQYIRYWFERDTAFTEVIGNLGTQLQRSALDKRPFPLVPGYLGLVDGLVHALHGSPGLGMPVLFLSSNGRTVDASLLEQGDRVSLRIPGSRLDATWTSTSGIDSAGYFGSQARILRGPVPPGVSFDTACRMAPLLGPRPSPLSG